MDGTAERHERFVVDKRVEKGSTTRAHLIEVATEIFADAGYDETSIETILSRSGVSRGALYHHFDGKESLFTAVLETAEERIANAIVRASKATANPIDAFKAGCKAWLDLARDREIRQIVLIDAPAVLGWQKWREIDERFGFGLLKSALSGAARQGYLPDDAVEITAHILLAAVLEVALLIARDPRPPRMSRAGRKTLDDLIDKLFVKPS